MPEPSQSWKGAGLILVSGSCWGFHGVLIKLALAEGYSFVQVFLFEIAIGTLFFAAFARKFFRGPRPQRRGEWLQLAVVGLATVGIGNGLFLAFSLGPIAIGATLMFLYLPLVYGYLLFSGREVFRWSKGLAIVLILAGAVLATGLIQVFSGGEGLGAVLPALVAAGCYSLVFLLTPGIATFTTLYFRSFVISGIGLLGSLVVLALFPFLWTADLRLTGSTLLLLGLLCGIGQILPVFTLMKGLSLIGSGLAGVLASVELPIAVISAAVVLGEPLGPARLAGVVLVLGGIATYQFAARPHSPAPVDP